MFASPVAGSVSERGFWLVKLHCDRDMALPGASSLPVSALSRRDVVPSDPSSDGCECEEDPSIS